MGIREYIELTIINFIQTRNNEISIHNRYMDVTILNMYRRKLDMSRCLLYCLEFCQKYCNFSHRNVSKILTYRCYTERYFDTLKYGNFISIQKYSTSSNHRKITG